MDLSKIKPEIIKKYYEHKTFLSNLDFWSCIDDVTHFSFKTSQVGFRYLQGNPDLAIAGQHVTSGRLAIFIEIEPIKLDDFLLEKIEIIQDIDIKANEVFFSSGTYVLKEEFNTKNSMNTKDLRIFDIRLQNGKLTMRLDKSGNEYIELTRDFSA